MTAVVALLAMQTGESYSRLGAAISADEWATFETVREGKGGTNSFLKGELSPLGAEKAAVDHWSGVLLGLQKVTDAPYAAGPVGDEAFRLAKLVGYAAHVSFAKGERHGGVTYLLNGLQMVARIRGENKAIAERCENNILRTFAKNLDSVPLLECERIRNHLYNVVLAGVPDGRERTQLMLLALHTRVQAYRWKFFKFPAQLSNAAVPSEILPGIRYETTTAGYRLRSDEFGELGSPDGRSARRTTRKLSMRTLWSSCFRESVSREECQMNEGPAIDLAQDRWQPVHLATDISSALCGRNVGQSPQGKRHRGSET